MNVIADHVPHWWYYGSLLLACVTTAAMCGTALLWILERLHSQPSPLSLFEPCVECGSLNIARVTQGGNHPTYFACMTCRHEWFPSKWEANA